MKKILVMSLLGMAVGLCGSPDTARAYGQVYFDNWNSTEILDGSIAGMPPVTSFAATLYIIPIIPDGLVHPVATTTGGSYGYFAGGLVSVPPYSPYQPVYLQVRAWYPTSYSSYEAAVASGNPAVRAGVSTTAYVYLGADGSSAEEPSEFGGFTLYRVMGATGSLQVSVGPPEAANAGPQWRVDSGSWQNGGATVSGLTVGIHGVDFKPVYGWGTPLSVSVYVNPNQTATAYGNYLEPGLLVQISPSNVGGMWRVDGGSWQFGATPVGVLPGSHQVGFLPVSGWATPADQWVTCTNFIVVSGVYKPHAAITPDAITGVSTNGFGMNLAGSPGAIFVVESSTNLVNWVPLQTNTLTSGAVHFSDPQWTNYPGRYYRLRAQ